MSHPIFLCNIHSLGVFSKYSDNSNVFLFVFCKKQAYSYSLPYAICIFITIYIHVFFKKLLIFFSLHLICNEHGLLNVSAGGGLKLKLITKRILNVNSQKLSMAIK